jgi:hypothetical protein
MNRMTARAVRLVRRRDIWAGIGALVFGGVVGALILSKSHGPVPPSPSGRLVDAGPVSAFKALQPKAFSQDDFDLIKLSDGRFVALYVYPPGYFGHAQGCTIRWNPEPDLDRTFHQPAMWMEGCSGSLSDPAGQRLFGPSRDLDQFAVTVRAGHVYVDTRTLECPAASAAAPCERAQGAVTQVFVTVTSSGFQPSRVEIPAGKPAYIILKNETSVIQSWHIVGVPDANVTRWPLPPIPFAAAFADGNDVHVVVPPGGQLGRPFTLTKRGTYTVVSDANPAHLHGTVVVH